jgi:hypothetical protein
MKAGRRLAIDALLLAAIGVVLGLIGPFGSDALPPVQRVLFWITFLLAGYAIFRPISVVAGWLEEETGSPPWLAVVLTTIVASLPLATLIAFALGGMRVTDFWFGNRFLLLYGQVAPVGVGIHLLMRFLFRARPARAVEPPPLARTDGEVAAGPESPFLRRLPPALGRDILRLEMQDHYVRAETRLGSAMVLMRFSDAVAELGSAGMQVHRSWWVARDAVASLHREGKRTRLRLVNGAAVPVSSAFLPQVREALGRGPGEGFDSTTLAAKSRKGDGPGRAAPGTIP